MPSPSDTRPELSSTLSTLPKEEVAHLADALTRPANANLTPEQLRDLLMTDPRVAQMLSQLQQTQSGGVNLGASNTIGKIDDAVAGDKVGGDKVGGDQINITYASPNKDTIELELMIKLIELFRSPAVQPPAAPPAPARDVAIDRYVRQFSDALKNSTTQGPKYDFPLTFQLISNTGEQIASSAGTPIDQLIAHAQNSRKVILRGVAGSGKTTAMQRTAALIDQRGYDTIVPLYIELRRLKPDTLQRVSENLEEKGTAEGYLEPLLDAAYSQPNIDTLKRLADLAESKADGMLLVLVDGLNEIYGEETASSILHRLDLYIQARPGASVIVSDRIMPRDAITQSWQVARIERIPQEVVFEQFKAKQIEAIYSQLTDNDRSLLQTAYFLNYALENNTARLSSPAEAIASFFKSLDEDLSFTDDALDRMAKAAFDAYKEHRNSTFDVQRFAQAIGQPNFDKLEDAGVIIRLPVDAASPPSAPQAQFDHPLKHDYLAARYLAQPNIEWTPESLDVVSFESNSFDALSMTLELLQDEKQCDKFIQRVHNWNWAAALVCIARAMRTGSGRHSQEIQLAVLALVAEKMFDSVQQTRKRANEVLSLFPPAIATPYKDIPSLPALYTLVQQQAQDETKYKNREPWFLDWCNLFVRFEGPPFNEQDLKQIVRGQAVVGWTAANVFRRFKLSDLDVRQLRAYYDACNACDYNDWRASTIRSRVIHALAATDTAAAVDLLLVALKEDHYLWARIGAARSLVEIAALTADADLRSRVIDTLIGMVVDAGIETLALKMLHEIGHSAFYCNAHDGWEEAVTPLIVKVRDRQNDNDPEKGWWSSLLADFEKFCQEQAPLAAGAVGASTAIAPQ